MVISSRTPEGMPNHCPLCGSDLKIEPSYPPGDALCPNCGHLLWFTENNDGGVEAVFPIKNWIDLGALASFLRSSVIRKGMKLVVDLQDIQHIPSADLNRLVELKKQLEPGKLRLRSIHPDVLQAFRICRLDHVFEIEA